MYRDGTRLTLRLLQTTLPASTKIKSTLPKMSFLMHAWNCPRLRKSSLRRKLTSLH